MDATTTEILSLVREEDVKFIRLAYCDLYGIQKNMAIMASQLPRAFAQGIPFDASAAARVLDPGAYRSLPGAGRLHRLHPAVAPGS